MTSDADGDCTTLLLPTPIGTLRVRIGGPGRLIREWARRRRDWGAQENLALLARLAEKGDVVGKLLTEGGRMDPVGRLPLPEAREVAAAFRRCMVHVQAHGLPAAGMRVQVAA
jgi:hypothetical protein